MSTKYSIKEPGICDVRITLGPNGLYCEECTITPPHIKNWTEKRIVYQEKITHYLSQTARDMFHHLKDHQVHGDLVPMALVLRLRDDYMDAQDAFVGTGEPPVWY